MKKILFLSLLLISLFACSANKVRIGIIDFEYGNLNKKHSRQSVESAAYYYLLALAANDKGDISRYIFNMNMAFISYPTSEKILNKYIPLLYQISEWDSTSVANYKQIIKIGKWAKKNKLKNSIIYLYAAKSYEKLGKLKKAENFYKLSINAEKTTDNLINYFEFLYDKKGILNKKLLVETINLINDDPETLLKVINVVRNIDADLATKLAKKYYQKYDTKDFCDLLVACYRDVSQEKKAFDVILKRISENKDVNVRTFSLYFIDYGFKNNLFNDKNLKYICKNNYVEQYPPAVIVRILFHYLLKANQDEILYNCIKKYKNILKNKINDEDTFTYWEFLNYNAFIRNGKYRELKDFMINTIKSDTTGITAEVFDHFATNSPDSIKSEIKKVINSIDDKNIRHTYLFLYYSDNNAPKKALEEFWQIEDDFFKKNVVLFVYLARVALKDNADTDKIFNIFKMNLPKSLSPVYVMGNLLSQIGREEDSIKFYEDYTKNNEFDYYKDVSDFVYKYYENPKCRDIILYIFDKLLKKEYDNADFLNSYGYFIALNKIKELYPLAQKLFTRALKIEPNNSMIIDSAGWLYFVMGDIKEAQKYFSKFDYKSVEYSEILYHLGIFNIKLNKTELAKKIFERIISLNKDEKYVSKAKQKLTELGERNN